MPRPGPRPYECIRRAWHSDSHQPLRGRLIQEIFRVVNELHSDSTRRNKEWQNKLPIVVLRAEEILYSKANSEDEYMDMKTLRTRLEDAVNTMIRREDNDESGGPFLEPCVEAALSFGCTPKKASRGQKHGPPRLCTSSARRTGSLLSSSASCLLGGAKCNHGSSSATSSHPCPGVTMQETGSRTIYCAASLPGFAKQGVSQNFAYHGSTDPLIAGIGTQDFGFGCPADDHVNPHAGMLPAFVRGKDLPQSIIGRTFSNSYSPGLVRAAEHGHQGSISPVGSTSTHLQMLPDVNQTGIQSTLIPRTTMDAGILCANSRWPHSPFIASSVASTPSCLVTSPDANAASTSRVYVDGDAHLDTRRCKAGGSQLHFSLDTGLQISIPCLAVNEKQINKAPSTGFPLSGRLARLGRYDEAGCSLTSALVLESGALVLGGGEKECPMASMEMHDLQLRLGPPGGVNKATPFDDKSDEPVALGSGIPSGETHQQHDASARTTDALNAFGGNSQLFTLASCWNGRSVDNFPFLMGYSAEKSENTEKDMPAAKRMRGESQLPPSGEGDLQMAVTFPYSNNFTTLGW